MTAKVEHPAEAHEQLVVGKRPGVVVEADKHFGRDAEAGAADPATLKTQPEGVDQGCDKQAEREEHCGCHEDPWCATRLEGCAPTRSDGAHDCLREGC